MATSGYTKDKIIVLQSIRHMESHLIIKGINLEGHIQSFFAKYALKSKKRFTGGVLEPGGYIQIEFRSAVQIDGLHSLHQATVINKFNAIRKDYDRLDTALHILRMVSTAGQLGGQKEPQLFHLLGNTLTALETTESLNLLKLFFEIRFLHLQGVLPEALQTSRVFFETKVENHHHIQLQSRDQVLLQNLTAQSLHEYLSF